MKNQSQRLIGAEAVGAGDGIPALLAALQAHGVTLLDRDGVLLARPLGPLPAVLRERIASNRDALLAEVQRRPLLIRTLLAEIPGARLEP